MKGRDREAVFFDPGALSRAVGQDRQIEPAGECEALQRPCLCRIVEAGCDDEKPRPLPPPAHRYAKERQAGAHSPLRMVLRAKIDNVGIGTEQIGEFGPGADDALAARKRADRGDRARRITREMTQRGQPLIPQPLCSDQHDPVIRPGLAIEEMRGDVELGVPRQAFGQGAHMDAGIDAERHELAHEYGQVLDILQFGPGRVTDQHEPLPSARPGEPPVSGGAWWPRPSPGRGPRPGTGPHRNARDPPAPRARGAYSAGVRR